MRNFRLASFLIGFAFLAYPGAARAQWPADPGPEGLLLYPYTISFDATPDALEGMYVGMGNFTGGHSTGAIGLQHVDAFGGLPWGDSAKWWAAAQMPIWHTNSPYLAPDGTGGVYALYFDGYEYPGGPTFDLVVTRVDANGTNLWHRVMVPASQTRKNWIAGDGAGGCLAVWTSYPATGYSPAPCYAQRLDASGNPLWGATGIALGITFDQLPAFAPDGAGGLYAAWGRPGANDLDIYAQHWDASGTPRWGAVGVPVCLASGDQGVVDPGWPGVIATADGAGGVCIAWTDARADAAVDIYAQRLNASRTALWAPDGVPVCTAAGSQYWQDSQYWDRGRQSQAVPDGTGGMILAWHDQRISGNIDLMAQRIDGTGTVRWTPDGAVVCDATGTQEFPDLAPDGASGVFATWADQRSPTTTQVFTQHLDGSGNRLWVPEGVFVAGSAISPFNPFYPFPRVVKCAVGATVAWQRGRAVHARYIPAPPTLLLVARSSYAGIPCFGGTATVTVSASGGTPPYTGTGTFTVGAGTYGYTVTDANGVTATTSVTVREPTQLVASSTQDAPVLCFGGTTTVTVRATGGSPPYTGTGSFTRGAGGGNYTVTDFHGCTATTSSTVTEPTQLVAISTQDAPILRHGEVTTVTVSASGGTAPYAGTGSFTVGAGTHDYTVTDANGCTTVTSVTVTEPAQLVASSIQDAPIPRYGGTTTVTVSASGGTAPYAGTGTFTVGAGTHDYTVTDANGSTATTSITVTEPPPRFALLGSRPNPATSSMDVSFTLASSGPVRIEAIDLSGRLVWDYQDDGLNAGAHSVRVRKLPPGLYLVRLRQRELVATKRVVFLR